MYNYRERDSLAGFTRDVKHMLEFTFEYRVEI